MGIMAMIEGLQIQKNTEIFQINSTEIKVCQ